MEYIKLGSTGMEVSRICLGCMTYGVAERGNQHWALPEEASRKLIRQAIDLGINFFDTANSYSGGTSEEIVGRALREFGARDNLVVATKVYFPAQPGPNGGGLSRKAILQALDASLTRMGMDYVDLYQIHRWDYGTPIEETLEALHDVVKAGKVRYIGASSMHAWQFAKALHISERNGWTRFVTMQDHYNLIYREEEREMHPLCVDQKIGVLPWSPLARGRLARDWNETTNRLEKDSYGASLYGPTAQADHAVIDSVSRVAKLRGVSRAQVALAWMLGKSVVTSPIVGASKAQHLQDAVAALSLTLSDDEKAELEGPYVPHAVAGFQ